MQLKSFYSIVCVFKKKYSLMFDGNVNNTKQVKHLYSSFLNVDIFWFLYSETAKWIVLGCGQNKKFEGCIRKYF